MRRVLPLTLPAVLLALGACTSASSRPGSYRASLDGGRAPLVGGVVDDNARLPEYLTYVAAYPHRDVPVIDLSDRRVVTVVGAEGAPLWDVPVVVATPSGPFATRTNAAGTFLFPPAAVGHPPHAAASMTVGGLPSVLPPAGMDLVQVPLARRPVGPQVVLDVALVVDTTGSMSDEVAALQQTLRSVVAQLSNHPLSPQVRVGGVAYRDIGDAYVTAPFDFTSDLTLVSRRLGTMTTGGGGDEPEAVQEALEDAVDRLSWTRDGAVRILFLVGDAPPHLQRGRPYTVTLRRALERGITVVPVACSGMNDTGEFVWRQLAAVTLGQFLFVSYGGSTTHHTGPYLENDLDVLLLRTARAQLDTLLTAGPPLAPIVTAPPIVTPPTILTPPTTWPNAQHPPSWPHPAPSPYPTAPARSGDRVGYGRAPWDFGVPGWSR